MDREELLFNEYKTYCEQKENFIDRNFKTNRFYMASIFVLIIALIYTGNVATSTLLQPIILFISNLY